ncbi:hypothetical protein EMCRGX_G015979 [Ephydatia muelleri]
MITKIVCENFKSYAGTQELGPFHKCFSSIVGPNGSGKSNVIDAMLFVFGYRAQKIRSKKVSVLIHNSEHHQDVQNCSVTVYFQKIVDLPGDDYQVVPNSSFYVSRTAFKDSSSYYQLNGQKVSFKELASLLRECGIDLDHNRFLILQGEVEQIAMMKPKAQTEHDEGMLEFLEDIVGTSRFKEPIEELSKKVEALNETRAEKLNRVKVVEKEKTDLEGAKVEAEEYLSLKKEVGRKQTFLYQRYVHECSQHQEKALARKNELEQQVKEMERSVAMQQGTRNDKSKEHQKDQKAYEELCEEDDRCKEGIASCEQRDIKARQDLKNAQNNIKKVSKGLEKEREQLSELLEAPDKLQKQIGDLEKKMKILEARKAEEEQRLAQVLEGLKTATKDLQEEKEALEPKLIELSQKANEARSEVDVARAELDIYRQKFSAIGRQISEAKGTLETIEKATADKTSELAAIEKELPRRAQQLVKVQEELKPLVEADARLSQQLKATRTQVEDTRSSLQANRSRGNVLDALMQQKSSGAIPGIYGRLGDLGAIDEKYDVAISTACGPLDNIVVDNMDTAVQCVEFLKANNIGHATFIGLDKMEHWRKPASTKISTPENVPRLVDLVRPKDAKFLTAFYFGLKDTLVTENLDQATRIGLQGHTRYRVVTESGQLIDISGTMSGGGGRAQRGRMSSKLHDDVTPQQLVAMEKALEAEERAMEECAGKKAELLERERRMRTEIAEMEKQKKKCSRDLELLQEQKTCLHQRMEDLDKQSAASQMDPVHLAKLEKQVQQFEKVHKKAAEAMGEVQKQVQSLQDEIMEVGGSRLQQQQAQLDKVVKEMDGSNEAITKAKVAIKTAERNTKKCKEKITSLEKDLATLEAKVEETKGVLTNLEEEARDIVAKQQGIHTSMRDLEQRLEQRKAELLELDKQENDAEVKLIDLKHSLETYNTKVKENLQKIKHFQNEMKKLGEGEEIQQLNEQELEALDKNAVEYEITTLETQLQQMTPNMAAIEEYKRKEEQYQSRLKDLDGVTAERDDARKAFEDMRKQRLDLFMAGFSVITSKLKEMYQMITLGGDAELELVDSLDPFSEGIVFSVRPPKKSWKNISNLSGGEKTLSSLALVFALHHYKPSPLYVMDEIDAALDFKNVSIVANYIKERTKNAQFIIISLRNNMFELADRLVGIFKTDNCTKSVTINPALLSMAVPVEGHP